MPIRISTITDIPHLQVILDQTGLFPREMLPDLMAPFLSGADEEVFLTAEIEGVPLGFVYAKAETLADRVWNMLALAVAPPHQRAGIGKMLVSGLEAELRQRGQRLMLVDTSSTAEYSGTRRFYQAMQYEQAAVIPDFWADGDDKVSFVKRL